MMDLPVKYNSLVAWKTYASSVYQLTREASTTPATFRVSVKEIDTNDLNPGETDAGYYLTDFLGIPYRIINSGVGYVDVSDDFKTKYCPVSGHICIIHKSAYKGYSLYLPADTFRHLHPAAFQNNNKYAMSILWQNDPNARRVAFTNVYSPSISDYRGTLVDMNGVIFNPMEDYGQDPKFEVYQLTEPGKYSRMNGTMEHQIIRSVTDGLIDSVIWSGTGELISGYYTISH